MFIKDQQTWPPSVIEPNFLTIPDISDSLRRYFIQQTGIEPKPWTVTYIRTQLGTYGQRRPLQTYSPDVGLSLDLTAPILPVEFYVSRLFGYSRSRNLSRSSRLAWRKSWRKSMTWPGVRFSVNSISMGEARAAHFCSPRSSSHSVDSSWAFATSRNSRTLFKVYTVRIPKRF